MKYRIAEKITFDTESDWIVCRDGDTVLMEKKLTKTAAQILAILLANYGELVERDYLLSEVWETRGHHGSNSSLNQYISILRKALFELGIPKECIASEPKKGFIFSRAVTVQEVSVQEQHVFDEERQSEVSQPLIFPTLVEATPPYRLRSERQCIINITLWVLVLITIIACLFLLHKTVGMKRTLDSEKLFSINHCSVYSDTKNYANYQSVMKEIIYDIHPDIEKQCTSPNMIVFVKVQPSIFFGHAGRVFIALCAGKANGDELTYCENNYRYNYTRRQEQ